MLGPAGKTLEVQIRTREMHRHAEYGVAAHWQYKEKAKTSKQFEEKIAWLRELLAWRDEVADWSKTRQARLDDAVYVLTPQGKVIDLPAGATPIDFAYALHTDLGHRCRGARVDGHIVALDTPLASGQRVEIVAAKSGGPSRDWLNAERGFVKSQRARQKIRQWFNNQAMQDTVAAGRAQVDTELRRLRATQANLDDTVYVLTPQGKVIDLPAGSTPIDFAYALHTDLGHRCRGARLDGQLVPLDTPLQSGQRVEIVAAKSGGPSRDWLNAERGFGHSHRARQKIRQWFNNQAMQDTVAAGRAQVDKELRRLRATQANLEQLAAKLGFKQPEELFAAVARDEVNLRQLQNALRGTEAPVKAVELPRKKATRGPKGGVLVVGMDSLMTQLARCCKPVPPDAVRGFVTRGKGVSVHREDCAALMRLAESHPERLLEAHWGKGEGSYTVDVGVTASDRRGLLRDIGDALARERINVTAVRTQTRDELAFMRFTFDVGDLAQLKRALAQVREVKGVIRAARA